VTSPRQPAAAGTFYPADPEVLAAGVDALLDSAPVPVGDPPAALVVPHAGHSCSGPVAATAFRQLRSARTVLVLGPGHFRDPGGLAVPECAAWRTPLGEVPIDVAACGHLVDGGLAHRSDHAHAGEHSIEVQLPFLQRALGLDWTLVPVVAGDVSAALVADCIDALAGDGAVVVVSSDLSHYHDEATARRLDERTAQAIVDREVALIGQRDACGAVVVRGLLVWALRHDREVSLLDLATSADTCGDRDRVVGYGAFAVA